MSADALEAAGFNVPEHLTWEELENLPERIADEIELWDRKVIWNRRGPLEHQRFPRRLANALEADARRAVSEATTDGSQRCWQVEVETNVFFTADKSSFLTPDFLIRRCLERDADTHAADVVLAGEVLSGSDTPKRRDWKMDRYAEAGIPWYWEVDLDAPGSWDVTETRAYELVTIPAQGLAVKPLRPQVYVLVGQWEPGDTAINFPEPFTVDITWDHLAF